MKTVSQVKKIYSKIDWYKQGAAAKPIYIGHSWKSCLGPLTLRGKRIPFSFLPFGVYLHKEDLMDVYFPRERLRAVAEFYYGKEKRQPGFVKNLKRRWERNEVTALQKIIRKIEKVDLSRLSIREVFDLQKKFSKFYQAFWREAIFVDGFDVTSDFILEEALRKEGKKIKENDLHLLTSPEELSWIQKEKRELLEIFRKYKKSLNVMPDSIGHPGSPEKSGWIPAGVYPAPRCGAGMTDGLGADLKRVLQKHADKYHWIYNDYAVVHWLDWKFFLKRLREFLDEKVYKEEKMAIADVLQAKKEKRRLVKKLKLSRRLVRTINLLVTAAAWRDWRKAYNQRASGAIRLFIEEFRKRTALDKNDAEHLWWWEIEGAAKLNRQKRELARKRRLGFFTDGDPEKGSFLGKDGAELQAFMTKLLARSEELRGRAAYHGLVRGRVKIILSQNDFHKMKKGDVLVAPNTRPEYAPIMKIAGAIISEEGGLTCHAAIVSRELKVPAIVGVQGAIAALRDGDLVEVDANIGVVKKL